jgi:glycosyltransferase involved in cell wall biosynthesis
VPRELPSFDLVVATVGRNDELGRLLDSLEAQEYPSLRVLVVDQNEDDSVGRHLNGRGLELVHLRSPLGLSRARNVALEQVNADVVAFPDDDCVYPQGLLERTGRRLAADPALDGITGRSADASGVSSPSWKTEAAVLADDNLWNRAISYTIFLRRSVVERVGRFDERLGLGSGERWSSGEEIDYLIRAVRLGARVEYDPTLVVQHDVRASDARIAYRDGASVGYLLRKHSYAPRVVARMLARPAGGAVVSTVRLDGAGARTRLATLRGRAGAYFGARRSKISA